MLYHIIFGLQVTVFLPEQMVTPGAIYPLPENCHPSPCSFCSRSPTMWTAPTCQAKASKHSELAPILRVDSRRVFP